MRPQRLLPLIVATALFIENMDSTAIATSLPQIAADLGTEPVALKLALTTYLVALAVFIPVSGWVADRFGARPTFMAAIGVFLLGSIGCAISGSLGELVAARFVQGMGGAMMGASIHQQMRALVYGERFPFEHYAAVVVLMAILIALIRKPKVLD